MSRWVWVCPEEKGGIRTYSEALWGALTSAPGTPSGCEILFTSDPRRIAALNPSLVHVQHEYGCFGSKVPWLYLFPRWVREMRRFIPEAKLVATAHTVIPKDYRYPVKGRGWQTPLRFGVNATLMPSLNRWWNHSSWKPLDAVVVHSGLQVETVRGSGCSLVREIPHFVPKISSQPIGAESLLLIFGFVSPEKGQDVVIRAIEKLPQTIKLRIVGGVRRKQDQGYYDHCVGLVKNMGLDERVQFSGFVRETDLDPAYAEARLVVAPFRETTGSGSLVQALARGKVVLASDLPLNREFSERVAGSLAFFRSEDVEDCARQIERLLRDEGAMRNLSRRALDYAARFSPEVTIGAHIRLYEELEARR